MLYFKSRGKLESIKHVFKMFFLFSSLLSNRKREIQPTIILHPNEYSQELHYYQFVVNLDRCSRS